MECQTPSNIKKSISIFYFNELRRTFKLSLLNQLFSLKFLMTILMSNTPFEKNETQFNFGCLFVWGRPYILYR